ncbi:hypothetical protein G7046_g7714 [Stylonectria norvegica]|nr:hypothetical protein G7046_g7714 [Stylonectria norvegica]
MSNGSFTNFPRLPPEIRQQIWQHALAQQAWSFSKPSRHKRQIKLLGKVHRPVGRACREARAVMRLTHTRLDLWGWLDFSRHLFFFRDSSFDKGLMMRIDERYGLLNHIQHIVVNARDWPNMWDTWDVVRNRCPMLRTMVIIGPWLEPNVDMDEDEMQIAPWEDFDPLFRNGAPTEAAVLPLLRAIDQGNAAEAARTAEYVNRLDQVTRRLPTEWQNLDNFWQRQEVTVQRLQGLILEFPCRTGLYLRRGDQIDNGAEKTLVSYEFLAWWDYATTYALSMLLLDIGIFECIARGAPPYVPRTIAFATGNYTKLVGRLKAANWALSLGMRTNLILNNDSDEEVNYRDDIDVDAPANSTPETSPSCSRKGKACRSRCKRTMSLLLITLLLLFASIFGYLWTTEARLNRPWEPDRESQRFSQRPLPPPSERNLIANYTLPLQTRGRYVVDAEGRRFKLASVNWYGASDELFVAGGLDVQHRNVIAQSIKRLGFNSVRLPYADELVMKNPVVEASTVAANLDLVGLTALEVFAAVVKALTDAGLAVIVNNHITSAAWCCGADPCDAGWANDHLGPVCRVRQNEDTWINNWEIIMLPHLHNKLVIGVDLRNEVRGLWGTMPWAKWASAAERCSNRLLKLNPEWLVVVEGTESANDVSGAAQRPIRLDVEDVLVYSAHVYGWSGWGSRDGRFVQRDYDSFARTMRHNWGYLLEAGTAPVWVGEFGSPHQPSVGDAHYWKNLMRYLKEVDADFGYWALNPRKPHGNEPDSYSLVQDDWVTPVVDYRMKDMLELTAALVELTSAFSGDGERARASVYVHFFIMERRSGNFQPIAVGHCQAQSAVERFGPGARDLIRRRERHDLGLDQGSGDDPPITWPSLSSSDEEENEEDRPLEKIVPCIQKFKNNLTGLSQDHNVQLSALKGHTGSSDLQLAPRCSYGALTLTATAPDVPIINSHEFTHVVNHLITGFLGNDEILVACYDDGDVVAYYTKTIAERVAKRCRKTGAASNPDAPQGPLKPFFHENVGESAWGLAVHQKSRLIAVSSNRHEVTVFAFGLSAPCPDTVNLYRRFSKMGHPDVLCRFRDWRIIISLGPEADNVPNICFVDTDNGSAEKICAIDINGVVWLAHIWVTKQPLICIASTRHPNMTSEEHGLARPRGWGVLALPTSSFMEVETIEQLYGMAREKVSLEHYGGPPVANIIRGLFEIPQNPCVPEAIHDQEHAPFDISAPDNSSPETLPQYQYLNPWVDDMPEGEAAGFSALESAPLEFMVSAGLGHDGADNLPLLDATNVSSSEDESFTTVTSARFLSPDFGKTRTPIAVFTPHTGEVKELDDKGEFADFILRPLEHNLLPRCTQLMRPHEGKLYFLRTFEKDIELRGFRPKKEVAVVCPNVIKPGPNRFHDAMTRLFFGTGRISMIAHLPELSIVALGSPRGWVVLLTLTRLAKPAWDTEGAGACGFRVEWVLPFTKDEDEHRKTPRPLYGMAVGPVQGTEGDSKRRVDLPRRYRLMLHYQNHDILTYEITRDEETGKICLF